METLRQDLSYGFRTLFKNPGFTAVAVLSLAIGIGANSAIFSVINALLLRPLPYQDADRLAILWQRSPGLNVAQDWFSPGQCLDVKAENQVFEQVAVTIGASFNLTGQGGPEHVDGARVTSSLFPLLGAKAALGRVLLPEEDSPGKPATVILSHGFWRRRFGGDPQVIGKTLVLSGSSFEIVGVMQPGFSLNKEVMLTVNAIERSVFSGSSTPRACQSSRRSRMPNPVASTLMNAPSSYRAERSNGRRSISSARRSVRAAATAAR